MATARYTHALTAIREVLGAAAGSLRTIPSTRLEERFAEGTAEEEAHRRGVRDAKPFRVEIVEQARHPASPSINGNLLLYRVTFVITVTRTINPAAQVDADTMHELRAAAWDDADVVRQALETPPNLQTTVDGDATDIAGSALVYVRTRARIVVERPPSQAQRYESVHTFQGVLISRPATS